RAGAALRNRLRSVMLMSLGGALAVSLAWLALESKAMSDASTLGETASAIPDVLLHTSFGHDLGLQALAIAGALASAATLRRTSLLALGFSGVAVLLEAGHGHGFAMADYALVASQALHLLASGAWLGALIPLLIVVRDAPPAKADLAARRF